MSRSPPRLVLHPGYPPHSGTPRERSPSHQYPHRPVLHPSYVQPGPPPHRTDLDPYHRPYHGDSRYIANYDYYRPYPPLPVQPHPPAPSAPPRVHHVHQHHREAFPPLDSPEGRPHLLSSAYSYRKDKTRYKPQHRPSPMSERAGSSHSDPEGHPYLSDNRSRSGPPGADEAEPTPSPLDPVRIQQWEDQQSRVRSRGTSSGSPSYRGDDADEEGDDVIDPALKDSSNRVPSVDEQKDGATEKEDNDLAEDDLPFLPRDKDLNLPGSCRRENSAYYPSAHHQAQFKALAEKESMLDPGEEEMNLNSLVDGDPNERPSYSIPVIIRCAILGSPKKQLTLSELYMAMEARFPYYCLGNKKSWRNSVRHNLSLNNQFDKKARPITEPGKGHYWIVAAGRPQGNKRERKRNKKLGKRALAALAAAEAEEKARAEAAGQNPTTDPSPVTSTSVLPEPAPPIPIDPQLLDTTATHTPTLPACLAGTLPANAGSYAAVTGALPSPAPIDPSLLRLWDGTTTSTSESPGLLQTNTMKSTSQEQSQTVNGRRATRGAQSRARSKPPYDEPQFGQPSLPLPSFGPPPQRELTPNTSQASMSSADSSSSSAGGVHRTVPKRAQRRYDPTAVQPRPPAAPRNAFTALTAQLERDGTGAVGSGGPAITARTRRNHARRLPSDDSESEDGELPSGDDEYIPG